MKIRIAVRTGVLTIWRRRCLRLVCWIALTALLFLAYGSPLFRLHAQTAEKQQASSETPLRQVRETVTEHNAPPSGTSAEEGIVAEVAAEYFRLREKHAAWERGYGKRDKKAVWDESFAVPSIATGIVVNKRGQPIAEAEVVIEAEAAREVLGRGRTNDKGHFHIPLSRDSYRGLDLEVNAKAYLRWAQGGIYGGLVDFRVEMDRVINQDFADEVLAQEDLGERLWLLLALVGERHILSGCDMREFYPLLGQLRQDLMRIATSDAFTTAGFDWIRRKRNDVLPPREMARYYLLLWHDPVDEPLFKKWDMKVGLTDVDFQQFNGETTEEVCEKWADYELARHAERPRSPSFSPPMICGAQMDHALVHFMIKDNMFVTYGQWLIIVRQEGKWYLKFIGIHATIS